MEFMCAAAHASTFSSSYNMKGLKKSIYRNKRLLIGKDCVAMNYMYIQMCMLTCAVYICMYMYVCDYSVECGHRYITSTHSSSCCSFFFPDLHIITSIWKKNMLFQECVLYIMYIISVFCESSLPPSLPPSLSLSPSWQ